MQAQIDYTTVEAITVKKTIAYVNNFFINTTQFLNRFSYLCEKKLNQVANGIQRLEITMSILEVKLASIPGVDGTASSAATVTPAATAAASQPSADDVEGGPPPPPSGQDNPSGGLTFKDDPRYARYFKMLKNGIPLAAVQQKLMMEGVSPDILSTPDGLSDFKESDAPKEAAVHSDKEDDDFDDSSDSDMG